MRTQPGKHRARAAISIAVSAGLRIGTGITPTPTANLLAGASVDEASGVSGGDDLDHFARAEQVTLGVAGESCRADTNRVAVVCPRGGFGESDDPWNPVVVDR